MSVFREFRAAMGWTQAQAAQALGGVPGRWRNYELGLRTPPPETAHAFIALARQHGHSYTLEDVYPPPRAGVAAREGSAA